MLRYVGEREATLWVETDAPCEVEIRDARAATFRIEGHHYALVELTDLEPGSSTEYEVRLDGRVVWPEEDSSFPPSVIRTHAPEAPVRVVFGSCRVSLPHEPPYVLHHWEDERAQGIDALRTRALAMLEQSPEDWPDAVLMLGDQVYADDLSPAMRERCASRADGAGAPTDELADFDEYAAAYREAWSEPVLRWLFSTVSTSMIFDDHEIHNEWKISEAWLEKMRAHDWYDRRISGGLMAYWVYQHIGNLSFEQLEAHDLLDQVRSEEDAGPLLREHMQKADRQAGHSRWSFCRDLGRTRLLVIDSRAGRDVTPGARKMVEPREWDWITDQVKSGDYDHLLLASSVPVFLTHGLHFLEAWDEAVADGAWGGIAAGPAERLRQGGNFDHWAAFGRSFHAFVELLEEVATGRHGTAPTSIVILSGDVHHCYLAEIGFPKGTQATSAVWQAVCSAYRKDLARREKVAMKVGNSDFGWALTRALARSAGVKHPPVGWRMHQHPTYNNQVATLTLEPGSARLKVETTVEADWRAPELSKVFEHQLVAGTALRSAFASGGEPVGGDATT
jgi:hypothetical protein